ALAKIGRRRLVKLTVPDFFSLGRVVSRSELVGLVPTWFANSIGEQLHLRSFALPFDMPRVALNLFWHRRHTNDPEHRWMRERMLELLRPIDLLHQPALAAHRKRKGPRADKHKAAQGSRSH